MNGENQFRGISISTTTILKVIIIILLLLFVYLIRDILLLLFIAFVISSGINPIINRLEKRKIPRFLSTLGLYFVLFLVITLVFILLVPPISEQFKQLSENFPLYYEKIVAGFQSLQKYAVEHGFSSDWQKTIGSVNQGLGQVTSGLFATFVSLFGGLVSFIGVLVITFYMSLDSQGASKLVHSIFPSKYQPYLTHLITKIQEKMGAWLQGQLLLCLIIGVVSFIGLKILGVKFALVLALIAGITEFIPVAGPIIGAIPAIFLAFFQSPIKAFLVIILYIVVQQLENHIIVPKVMQRSVGLNPIIVIIAMLIGAKLAGILGMILAVPVATIVSIFFGDFFAERRAREKEAL